MSKDLIIFTLNGCDHCDSLKLTLKEKNIIFNDIEITQYPNIWKQVVEQTNTNLLPTVFIRNENSEDGLVFVPGRDYQSEESLIMLIESHLIKED